MFLIAITKDGIADNFQSEKVEEFNLNSSKVTVVTDDFLSEFIPKSDGFSVIESPLIKDSDYNDIIFSKVTYNNKNKTLIVFKSSVSGRHIYYYLNSKGDFFCSTHISMLKDAKVPIEENTDVLPEFFIYRFIMPPNTLYKNIYQIHTDSQFHIKFDNGKCKIFNEKRNIPSKSTNNINIDNISKYSLDFLDKAIQFLQPKKDKISILFSGGLDSSILLKLCQKHYKLDSVFSTSFPFEDIKNNQEKEYSLSASKYFDVKNYNFEPTSEQYITGLIEAISHNEIPVHHLQSVLIYLLSKKIPKKQNILLCGLGADVLFGTSIHSRLFYQNQKLLYRLSNKYPLNYLIKLLANKNSKFEKFFTSKDNPNNTSHEINDIIWSIGNYGCEKWTEKFFNAKIKEITKSRYNEIENYKNRSIYDIISLFLFFGSLSTSQSVWSKLGESEEKIIYYPFGNNDLINYTFSIPWEVKLKNYKNILKNIAQKLEIPKFIINRPKSSFGIISKVWTEKGGIFEPLVPLASKVFNEEDIRKVQSPEPKKAMIYWNILNYSIWKRLFINNEPLEILLEELREN